MTPTTSTEEEGTVCKRTCRGRNRLLLLLLLVFLASSVRFLAAGEQWQNFGIAIVGISAQGVVKKSPFDKKGSNVGGLPSSNNDTRNSSSCHMPATQRNKTTSIHDTSIIIISSLIPSHPSLYMINETVNSLRYLRGLSAKAPIFFAVDGLRDRATSQDRERLHQYVTNLYQTFDKPHHRIVVSNIHLHIGGNIQQAHRLVKTKYIYVIQHDFPFCGEVNHSAIVKTMREYPDTLRIVRFNKRINEPVLSDSEECFGQATAVDHVNGVNFTKTAGWSDNNHLTTWKYYDEILSMLVYLKRSVEGPMMYNAQKDCSQWGPHLYGSRGDGPYICHLDGRNTHNITRS